MAIQFYNGVFLPQEEIKFSINDTGILRGYGVFDYFIALEGVPVFMKDHLDRFESSAKLLGIPIPYSREKLEKTIYELIKVNGHQAGSIKIVMTGGETMDGFTPGKPNLAILNNPWQLPPAEYFSEGISLMTYDYTREFPRAKSTSYAMALRLQPAWEQGGHIDVLYHENGTVTEVSRSNVFFFKGEVLVTNEADILKGVNRKHVLKVAEDEFKVEIRSFTVEELTGADEAFITSSNKRIMPLIGIEKEKIGNGKPGPKTQQMMRLFEEYISAYVKAHKSATTTLL